MNSQRARERIIGPARLVLPVLWFACSLLPSPGPVQAQDIEVAFTEIASLDARGRPRAEFLPGEEIQVLVRALVLRSSRNPFAVRLRISGDGWYEVQSREVFWAPGPHSITYGGLYTSAGASPGKVSLVADIFSLEGTVSLRGRRHTYVTIRCPDGIPAAKTARLQQVGRFPIDMALTEDGRFLYVTSQEDRKVTVIDAEGKAVAATLGPDEGMGLPAGTAFVPGGEEMLVADAAFQAIHRIEAGAPFALLETIPLNPEGAFGVVSPGELAVNIRRNEVYVIDSSGPRIFTLNLASKAVQQIVLFTSVSSGLTPIQIIVDPENPRFIYVLCQALNEVLKLDVSSGQLLDYVRFKVPPDPSSLWPAWSMALNPVTDELYVLVNPGGRENPEEDPIFESKSKIYAFRKDWFGGPGRREFLVGSSLWDLAVRQDGRFVYAIDSYRGEILVIDMNRGISLDRCAIPVGPGGRLLRLEPVQNRLFVGNWAPGYVDIVE